MDLSPEQWKRVSNLFDAVCDLSWAEQQAHLQDADISPAIRDEVEALLAADADDSSFLEAGAASLAETFVDEAVNTYARAAEYHLEPGARVGAYRVVEPIGEGGMGAVYRAERADGSFTKQVALKVIRRGRATPESIRRFEHERQILAQLEHPNIARLVDGGITDDGQPYFIMEYVEGQPIDAYCAEHDLPLQARVDLLVDVCDAVQYAHRRLVVHRDLKPDNILVTEEGTIKLLDFGIAKLLAEDESNTPQHTVAQRMTPAYASPEQVQNGAVTPATDVYALGVIAYTLLSGAPPYRFEDQTPTSIAEVIIHAVPTRPSTALRTLPETSNAPSRPSYMSGRLQGDLDAIVMKALKKEPERRYATAGVLLEDLEQFQAGHPVQARDDTTWYRTRKFVARNQWAVLAASLALVALLGGSAATFWQAQQATAEAERANQTLDFFLQTFEDIDPSHVEAQGGMIAPDDLLGRGMRRAEQLSDQPRVQASVLQGLGQLSLSLGAFDTADSLAEQSRTLWATTRGADADAYTRATLLRAEALLEQRAYDEAEALAREQTRARSTALRLQAHTLHGSILYRQGRSDDAAAAYQRALDTPGDSLRIAEAQLGLGDVYLLQDSTALALALFKEALDVYQTRSPESPETAQAHYQMATALQRAGRPEDATAHFERALHVYEQVYGARDYRVATTQYALARLYEDQNQYDNATLLYQDAISTYEASPMRALHLWKAYPRVGMGRTRLSQSRPADAVSYLEQALEIIRAELGDSDSRAALAQGLLGAAYAQTGQFSEAEPLLQAGEAQATNRPDLKRHLLAGYVALYTAQGRTDEAASAQAELEALQAGEE